MNELADQKAGAIVCKGNPPKEIARLISTYNKLLNAEGMVPISKIPSRMKSPLLELAGHKSLQAILLLNRTINLRTFVIKEGEQ
jgi:hypothetical protein